VAYLNSFPRIGELVKPKAEEVERRMKQVKPHLLLPMHISPIEKYRIKSSHGGKDRTLQSKGMFGPFIALCYFTA